MLLGHSTPDNFCHTKKHKPYSLPQDISWTNAIQQEWDHVLKARWLLSCKSAAMTISLQGEVYAIQCMVTSYAGYPVWPLQHICPTHQYYRHKHRASVEICLSRYSAGGGQGRETDDLPGTDDAALGIQASCFLGVPLLGFHCSPSLQHALKLSFGQHTYRHRYADRHTDRQTDTCCAFSHVSDCPPCNTVLGLNVVSGKSAGLSAYMMHSLNSNGSNLPCKSWR